jgi:hypothetical protein
LDGSKDSQETVHEVKNSVDASFASSTVGLSTTTVLGSSSTLAPSVDSSTSDLVTTTPSLNQVVEKIDASVVQAQTVADEAKVLLDGNKVGEAFEKVKTLNTLVSENNNNVVQAQEAAGIQIVAPSVSTTTQDLTISSTSTP